MHISADLMPFERRRIISISCFAAIGIPSFCAPVAMNYISAKVFDADAAIYMKMPLPSRTLRHLLAHLVTEAPRLTNSKKTKS